MALLLPPVNSEVDGSGQQILSRACLTSTSDTTIRGQQGSDKSYRYVLYHTAHNIWYPKQEYGTNCFGLFYLIFKCLFMLHCDKIVSTMREDIAVLVYMLWPVVFRVPFCRTNVYDVVIAWSHRQHQLWRWEEETHILFIFLVSPLLPSFCTIFFLPIVFTHLLCPRICVLRHSKVASKRAGSLLR